MTDWMPGDRVEYNDGRPDHDSDGTRRVRPTGSVVQVEGSHVTVEWDTTDSPQPMVPESSLRVGTPDNIWDRIKELRRQAHAAGEMGLFGTCQAALNEGNEGAILECDRAMRARGGLTMLATYDHTADYRRFRAAMHRTGWRHSPVSGNPYMDQPLFRVGAGEHVLGAVLLGARPNGATWWDPRRREAFESVAPGMARATGVHVGHLPLDTALAACAAMEQHGRNPWTQAP